MTAIPPALLEQCRSTYAQTTQLVPTRDELPVLLNHRQLLGVGVEIGVQHGQFSAKILEQWQGRLLYSVDPWLEDPTGKWVDEANVPQSYQDLFYEQTRETLAHFGERSAIRRLTSVEAAAEMPDASVDFVYIDARHDYAPVMEDLHAWFPKVRAGGIIAGHDYINGTFPAGVFEVKRAVDEFFEARGLSVKATLADKPCVSWIVEVPN